MSCCSEDMYRWGRLDIPSRPECVPAVRRAAARLGARAGLSAEDQEDLDLAVTEACGNAIRHGSPQRERNTIRITFFSGPESVMVEIRDEGAGFDPESKGLPSPWELRDGGYGLHIMRQVVDDVDIAWQGGTVVRLMKWRRPRRAAPRGSSAAGGIPEGVLVPALA